MLEQLQLHEPDLAALVAGSDTIKVTAEAELYTTLWKEFSEGRLEINYEGIARLLGKFFKTKGYRDSASEIKSECVLEPAAMGGA